MRYLSVAIENSASVMDILYTYSYSGEDINIGDSVIIPFGVHNGRRKGFVFEIKEETDVSPNRIKPIIKREGPVLSKEAVSLCCFMKEKCLCRYIDGINCFLPVGYYRYEDVLSLTDKAKAEEFADNPKSPRRQREAVRLLLERGELKKSILKNIYGIDYSVMAALIKKGLAVQGRVQKQRRPHQGIKPEREGRVLLNEEQSTAFSKIKESIHGDEHRTFLIHGVTGSGKTRLYMEAIDEALSVGKTAIMLVPEIALTMQVIVSFRAKFGEDNVAVLHSKLSDGERYDEWMRIKKGEARIVLGPRSAVFAPVENLGVIVIDEEHESSYKADHSPKYDTRELAEELARLNNGVLIMGSATPSVTSYYRSEIGEIEKLELKSRYNKTVLPLVDMIDMREELKRGNKSIFSVKLYEEMKKCLEDRKQIILFLNRRGYSSFVSCRSCGYTAKCPECGISMTYHKYSGKLVCHYCERTVKLPKTCPDCGSKYIKDFGVGTEKVEEICSKLFPNAAVARMDLDTVKKKGSAETILSDFRQGKTDILVGTQLVAKGLDFANVDLVGIIAADISLNIPDYRSAERTFQLVTQAAGRSGRGEIQGRVVVQTYSPDHFALKAASGHDYHDFFRQEIEVRKALEYPPFGQMIQVVFLDNSEDKAKGCAEDFSRELTGIMGEDFASVILGPKPTHITKIGGRYRYQILIKCKDSEMKKCIDSIDELRTVFAAEKYKSTLIGIDVNPYGTV